MLLRQQSRYIRLCGDRPDSLRQEVFTVLVPQRNSTISSLQICCCRMVCSQGCSNVQSCHRLTQKESFAKRSQPCSLKREARPCSSSRHARVPILEAHSSKQQQRATLRCAASQGAVASGRNDQYVGADAACGSAYPAPLLDAFNLFGQTTSNLLTTLSCPRLMRVCQQAFAPRKPCILRVVLSWQPSPPDPCSLPPSMAQRPG